MSLARVSALLFFAHAIEFADSTSDAGVVLAAISVVQTCQVDRLLPPGIAKEEHGKVLRDIMAPNRRCNHKYPSMVLSSPAAVRGMFLFSRRCCSSSTKTNLRGSVSIDPCLMRRNCASVRRLAVIVLGECSRNVLPRRHSTGTDAANGYPAFASCRKLQAFV